MHVELREPDATAGAGAGHHTGDHTGDQAGDQAGDQTGDPRPEPTVEPPVDDVPPESAEPEGRRYPSTLGGLCYLLVLGISAVGLGIVTRGDWRLGVKWIAAALVFAALVRLVIPVQQAGMLAVRRRAVDVVILAALGAALWFLSTSIPNQPPL